MNALAKQIILLEILDLLTGSKNFRLLHTHNCLHGNYKRMRGFFHVTVNLTAL